MAYRNHADPMHYYRGEKQHPSDVEVDDTEMDAFEAAQIAAQAAIDANKAAQQLADAQAKEEAKGVAALAYLANHTNAEIRTFIDGNINVAAVTDLASAKACLSRIENRLEDLAIGLAVLVRRELR